MTTDLHAIRDLGGAPTGGAAQLAGSAAAAGAIAAICSLAQIIAAAACPSSQFLRLVVALA